MKFKTTTEIQDGLKELGEDIRFNAGVLSVSMAVKASVSVIDNSESAYFHVGEDECSLNIAMTGVKVSNATFPTYGEMHITLNVFVWEKEPIGVECGMNDYGEIEYRIPATALHIDDKYDLSICLEDIVTYLKDERGRDVCKVD